MLLLLHHPCGRGRQQIGLHQGGRRKNLLPSAGAQVVLLREGVTAAQQKGVVVSRTTILRITLSRLHRFLLKERIPARQVLLNWLAAGEVTQTAQVEGDWSSTNRKNLPQTLKHLVDLHLSLPKPIASPIFVTNTQTKARQSWNCTESPRVNAVTQSETKYSTGVPLPGLNAVPLLKGGKFCHQRAQLRVRTKNWHSQLEDHRLL